MRERNWHNKINTQAMSVRQHRSGLVSFTVISDIWNGVGEGKNSYNLILSAEQIHWLAPILAKRSAELKRWEKKK
jgi:hypothetical protein